jgi:hypothetical protein
MSFTHCKLEKLPNWPDWDAAFDAKKLDAHFKAGALGLPVPRPPSTPTIAPMFFGFNGLMSSSRMANVDIAHLLMTTVVLCHGGEQMHELVLCSCCNKLLDFL